MTAAEPQTLTQQYQWATDRLRQEFGEEHVWAKEFEWGTSFGVALQVGDRRLGWKLEYHWITNYDVGEPYWDEDDGEWRRRPPPGGWAYATFSLNACADREERLTAMIHRARTDESPSAARCR
jgi:hypothetical protein